MAKKAIAQDEFDEWLTPADALARLPFSTENARQDWIFRRLETGRIRACAEFAKISDQRGVRRLKLQIIPEHLWRWPWRRSASDFWETGDIEFSSSALLTGAIVVGPNDLSSIGRSDEATYQGVRFDPIEFPPAAASLTTASNAGRPPATWWDDLWIEITRQLYVGELIPDSQALIERAMHDWLAANDHQAGETTVRKRARALFRALNRKDTN